MIPNRRARRTSPAPNVASRSVFSGPDSSSRSTSIGLPKGGKRASTMPVARSSWTMFFTPTVRRMRAVPSSPATSTRPRRLITLRCRSGATSISAPTPFRRSHGYCRDLPLTVPSCSDQVQNQRSNPLADNELKMTTPPAEKLSTRISRSGIPLHGTLCRFPSLWCRRLTRGTLSPPRNHPIHPDRSRLGASPRNHYPCTSRLLPPVGRPQEGS
jgi:hypothetical protein